MPKRHKIRNNKLLLTFLKSEDSGVYKCTTAYDECYKFRVTIDNKETKAKENKKEKKATAKEASSPTIKLFKSVNDQSKNQMTTTTDEVEYEEDYDETATTNATQAIKTTASNIDDDKDEDEDDQEEEITTTTPTSEVEYYDDDEPIKVTVSSGSVAELVCADSTQYDEYIDWGRPDKVTAFILVDDVFF